MSIGPVSGNSSFAASAWASSLAARTAPTAAPPAAGTSSEDLLASLAGGTGRSASAGSQSAAQSMLDAVQDPARVETAGYYNQLAMLNAFSTGTDGSDGSSTSDGDSDPFAMLSRSVASTYNAQVARYGAGVSSAGINFLA